MDLPAGVSDSTPIIVGQGRITQRSPLSLSEALDPIRLMAEAARLAAADAGSTDILAKVGSVASVQMLLEPRVPQKVRPLYPNPVRSVASVVGAVAAKRFFHTTSGGQSPQLAVNELSELISKGSIESALIVGAECLATYMRARKQGWTLPGEKRPTDSAHEPCVLAWGHQPGGAEPETLGYKMEWPMVDLHGLVHGLHVPTTIYALIEQAIRRHKNQSDAEHTASVAALFSGFSAVAHRNPQLAWFPTKRSPEELSTPTSENRYVTRPGYTKCVVQPTMCRLEPVLCCRDDIL